MRLLNIGFLFGALGGAFTMVPLAHGDTWTAAISFGMLLFGFFVVAPALRRRNQRPDDEPDHA